LEFVTLLSLLLWIASVTLWIQSRIADLAFLHAGEKDIDVRSFGARSRETASPFADLLGYVLICTELP
jgi:hypothetical protein